MRGLPLTGAAAMKCLLSKIAMIAIILLAACEPTDSDMPTVAGRWYTESQVEAGRVLYGEHCSVCHGADGSGTVDWRTPGPDGHYPPPPLNGTAHTWHHPLEQLDHSIANGGVEFGGVMPGFAAFLDADQRMAIIARVQTWWPDDIYAKWDAINDRSD
jgi:mono/diheme cytochrome c family protein